MVKFTTILVALAASIVSGYKNELMEPEGLTKQMKEGVVSSSLDHLNVPMDDLPESFSWKNVDGVSYVTKMLNQHIPVYCGSCWAHGTMSALADRIKINRIKSGDVGPDINLAIQTILNCGQTIAGSCEGGSPAGAYAFVHGLTLEGKGIPFDTCNNYQAKDGQCDFEDGVNPSGSCMTCGTFGVPCVDIDQYPNATVTEYGKISGEQQMMAEIYARGPIACGVNAMPLVNYTGGVYSDNRRFNMIDHEISVAGWGVDENGVKYWDLRNSWGEYWGELGWARIERGDNTLAIEKECYWAVGDYSKVNYPCYEGGENC
jgi:cathepsin X